MKKRRKRSTRKMRRSSASAALLSRCRVGALVCAAVGHQAQAGHPAQEAEAVDRTHHQEEEVDHHLHQGRHPAVYHGCHLTEQRPGTRSRLTPTRSHRLRDVASGPLSCPHTRRTSPFGAGRSL